jgi:hypothetical protein
MNVGKTFVGFEPDNSGCPSADPNEAQMLFESSNSAHLGGILLWVVWLSIIRAAQPVTQPSYPRATMLHPGVIAMHDEGYPLFATKIGKSVGTLDLLPHSVDIDVVGDESKKHLSACRSRHNASAGKHGVSGDHFVDSSLVQPGVEGFNERLHWTIRDLLGELVGALKCALDGFQWEPRKIALEVFRLLDGGAGACRESHRIERFIATQQLVFL